MTVSSGSGRDTRPWWLLSVPEWPATLRTERCRVSRYGVALCEWMQGDATFSWAHERLLQTVIVLTKERTLAANLESVLEETLSADDLDGVLEG